MNGSELVRLNECDIDLSVASAIPVETGREYGLIAMGRHGAMLTVALSDPQNERAFAAIRRFVGAPVYFVMAPRADVLAAYARLAAYERLSTRSGRAPAIDSPQTRRPAGRSLGGRGEPMEASWHELLRPLCAEACEVAGAGARVEPVLFFVARWCQKETRAAEPDVAALDQDHLADIAARVVRNLDDDGAHVDRIVAGDAGAWDELRRLLFASARRRVDAASAAHYADEARQKIAIVLLTGTPPSRAAAQLVEAIEGPRNEYVFTSPFPFWARAVVIHLIIDGLRRQSGAREVPQVHTTRTPPCLDAATLKGALDALPGLLDAIAELPPVQRSVMVWTLTRRDLDPVVTDHLRELAPDLFAETGDGAVSSDSDIAERLGTTARLVAANRYAARYKLAARNPYWKLLLDALMPHRSTRSTQEENHDG